MFTVGLCRLLLAWLRECRGHCQHPACDRGGAFVQVDDDFLGSPPIQERRCPQHLPA